MPSQGTVIARVYTSDAYIPLPGANVVFTQNVDEDKETILAIKITDISGLTSPLALNTPDTEESLKPANGEKPYTLVNIYVSYPNYSSIAAKGVQVFPNVETIQGLQLQPVTEFNRNQLFTVPAETQPL